MSPRGWRLTDAPSRSGLHGSRARARTSSASCRTRRCRIPRTCCRAVRNWRSTSIARSTAYMPVKARPVLAAPHASRAQFAAQPLQRSAHRARHQLHPDLGALHLGYPRDRHAGARRGRSTVDFDDERRPTQEGRARRERAFHADAVARFRGHERQVKRENKVAGRQEVANAHDLVCRITTAMPIRPSPNARTTPGPMGKRLAVYLGLNIEHFAFGAGEGHLLTVANPPPDPRTFAWRDYGNRVGVWRLPRPVRRTQSCRPRT